jgi:threonine dehydrogenase-like Zn-dependent dehydrogenase
VAARHPEIPSTQFAVQLAGPGRLTLNRAKPVGPVGPHTILAKVEAVGLCFSDLKVLKQFSAHPRKGEILGGISKEALAGLAGYVPGDMPTVPGHEAVCRIVAVGAKVRHHRAGERVIVQADYRALRTAGSNAAFGYNFEGALQEYVAMDERVVVDDATGEHYLIKVGDALGASALCLVEPWACVEESYASPERRAPKPGGRMLVVAEAGHKVEGLVESFGREGGPVAIAAVCAAESQLAALSGIGAAVTRVQDITGLPCEAFDDVVYFGARRESIEVLNDRLAHGGIINIVTGGERIGHVSVGVGRVHYGLTRWIGTTGTRAAESYARIPATGEIRPGEKMLVIGAGGPMGQMHVLRAIASGVPGVEITATDFDDARLEALERKAGAAAKARRVPLELVNPQRGAPETRPTYVAIMAPLAALVAGAVKECGSGCLINIFAGIQASVREPMDLDSYITKGVYMFGSSGSVVRDMKLVLEKVESGRLDTNASVDAISGMAGALDGLAAVENRTLSGKIVVYPEFRELGLVPLSELAARYPSVAAKLENGAWSKAAEDELHRVLRR